MPLTPRVFELGKPVGVIVALVTTVPMMLGGGLAENVAVMFTTLGCGTPEDARL
jgi:hypothetical protein